MNKTALYPTLDGLLDLACRDGVDIRPTLLRVLTDLYVQKPTHSAEEETQYVELALGLIEMVDEPTRAAAVASLSAYPGAPAEVLRKLTPPQSSLGVDTSLESHSVSGDLIELFFDAQPDERRLILTNLDVGVAAPPRRATSAMSEVVRRLEAAAMRRNAGEFGRILARALSIAPALAERIARDDSGEPAVIVARALGMTAAVLQRVLLFLNPAIGQSIDRVHELARLFDELTPQAATRMVAIWQDAGAPARPAHQPVHWDDERRGARPQAAPVRQRAATDRKELPSRFKTGEQ